MVPSAETPRYSDPLQRMQVSYSTGGTGMPAGISSIANFAPIIGGMTETAQPIPTFGRPDKAACHALNTIADNNADYLSTTRAININGLHHGLLGVGYIAAAAEAAKTIDDAIISAAPNHEKIPNTNARNPPANTARATAVRRLMMHLRRYAWFGRSGEAHECA